MNNIQRLLNNKKYKEALYLAEKTVYLAAYEYTGRNQVRTAKMLGVARGTLINRLKKYEY